MPEEALTQPTTLPGWYGKLPCLGDFASRRLPDAAFVQPWDAWLQQGLASARAALGERWLDVYLVAPVLRFWLAPGVLDGPGARDAAAAWAGLLMPSVDRVGRHFPLTLARPAASLAAALAARDWVDAADAAARRVLDVSFGVDEFEHALGALPDDAHGEASIDDWALAERLHGAGAPPASLWWCGRAAAGTEYRRFDGLPPRGEFAALMGASA